jgi:hypothetical protein
LHQDGGERRQYQHGDPGDGVAVPAAEEEREPGNHHHGTRHSRGHRVRQHISVLDVGQLVGRHAGQLLGRHGLEDTFGETDDGFLGVTSRGEGVRLIAGRDGYRGHRQPGLLP